MPCKGGEGTLLLFPWEEEKHRLWIVALQQKNADCSDQRPSKSDCVCGDLWVCHTKTPAIWSVTMGYDNPCAVNSVLLGQLQSW